jgi:myo-inositol-1(or 4)-monophosphatase
MDSRAFTQLTSMTNPTFLSVATALAHEAGASLLSTFGSERVIAKKGDHSNVVTAADTRSEALIVNGLRQAFPEHAIISEESGCELSASPYTWVVDPLDGTSNFAAGIPWFGVLIALLKEGMPIVGVLYLPAIGDLYTAEAGKGAFKNGERIFVTQSELLSDVLWAYGMDGGSTDADAQKNVAILSRS